VTKLKQVGEIKKLYTRDGRSVGLHPSTKEQPYKKFWLSCGPETRKPLAFTCPATMTNHVLNAYQVLNAEYLKKYDKYIAVYDVFLRRAKIFHIRMLRMLFQTVEDTEVGQRLIVNYGYIPRLHFSHLRKRRKLVPSVYGNVRLLKTSDFEMRRK
jgi:hypothetical protein